MSLPKLPKKEPRVVPVSVRLSKNTAEQLKTLAKEHNLSQADVLEYLVQNEFKNFENNKKTKQPLKLSNDLSVEGKKLIQGLISKGLVTDNGGEYYFK